MMVLESEKDRRLPTEAVMSRWQIDLMKTRSIKAISLLSGGMDSATTLAIALEECHEVRAISFLYGQRHAKEIDSARMIADYFGVPHKVYESDLKMMKSELTTGEPLNLVGLPSTYVPARNGLFLLYAMGIAQSLGYHRVYIGVNEIDASYPDCTMNFIQQMQKIFDIYTGGNIMICAPLIHLDKAGIVREGERLGVPWRLSWSCYHNGDKPCKKCDSCIKRAEGFRKAGIHDPLDDIP